MKVEPQVPSKDVFEAAFAIRDDPNRFKSLAYLSARLIVLLRLLHALSLGILLLETPIYRHELTAAHGHTGSQGHMFLATPTSSKDWQRPIYRGEAHEGACRCF